MNKSTLRPLLIMIVVILSLMTIVSIIMSLDMLHDSPGKVSLFVLTVDGASIAGILLGWLILKLVSPHIKAYVDSYPAQKVLSIQSQCNLPEEIYIEYELDSNDFDTFKTFNFEKSPKIGRGWRIIKTSEIIASFIYLLLAIILYVAFGKELLIVSIIFVGLSILTIVLFIVSPSQIRKNLKKSTLKNYIQSRNVIGKHKLFINFETITDFHDDGKIKAEWNDIDYILSNNKYLFIVKRDATYYIVPRRAFSNEKAFRDYINTVSTYHKASQIGSNIN